MPLPNRSLPWPPKQLQTITAKQAEHSAWYVGEVDGLIATYRGNNRPAPRPSTYRGGIVGALARWFWGAPSGSNDEPRIRLHVPLAADICQASADLLFADPPTITGSDERTSARLDTYAEDGLSGILSHGAEVAAALGGTYLRATWDAGLQSRPFLSTVDADAAWPEFRWGRLSAVTFWWRLPVTDRGTVYRHLERHEIVDGIGVVEHGLYRGTDGELGARVNLLERPETAGLAVNADSIISTESPGLDVAYVPNLLPQRAWRSDPTGRNLGRADLDGVESLMDALDRVYSSWMRDVDLGKGRITIPEYMLQVGKPGEGVSVDLDREVYQGINAAPTSSTGPMISQFEIRVAEHQATAQQLVEDILRACGYSAQTFGEDEGGAATATEIVARDRRSMLTRDRKIRLWQPAIRDMVAKMLAIDRAIFNAPVDPEGVSVKFSDSSQDTPLQLAQTAQAMAAAQAASTQTKVTLLHPDWDETQVAEEVARINTELGIGAMADPLTVGVPNDSEPPAADAVAF